MRRKWIKSVQCVKHNFSEASVKKSTRICSLHFNSEDFKSNRKYKILLPEAVPSGKEVIQHTSHSVIHTRDSASIKFGSRVLQEHSYSLTKPLDNNVVEFYSPESIPTANNVEIETKLNSPKKIKLRRKIKTLKQKLKRKEKKLNTLTRIIKKLESMNFINSEIAKILNENFSGLTKQIFESLLRNMNRKNKGRRYTEEVKKFALTVHFYSPRAYDFLRTIFLLPCQRALSSWNSSVRCEPGILRDVFVYLEAKGKEDSNYKDCALMFDGMFIKSGVVFNKNEGKYEGFNNFGTNVLVCNTEEVATEALFYMLVGLKGHWKVPVAYILCKSANSSNISSLTNNVLATAAEHGITVRSVTCDGAAANIEAMRQLGCKLGCAPSQIDGSFKHPLFNQNLHFFLDPCHMIKLARNTLADLGELCDGDGGIIKWDLIKKLYNLQEKEGLKLGNKISRSHIEFQKNKMKVKLATQVLSNSVADSLQFLMELGHPDFHDASATINFIKKLDAMFDLLNLKNPFGKGLKQPITLTNFDTIKVKVDEWISYLSNITVQGEVPLLLHRRKTFVLGFITSLKSTITLAHDVLNDSFNKFKYFLTYKVSQDHLELLLSCIRGKHGFNNNPNAIQLKSSLKKLLMKNFINVSTHANCLPIDTTSSASIFSIKWNKPNQNILEDTTPVDKDYENFLSSCLSCVSMNSYKKAILGYVSGYIVKKLKDKITCKDCCNALFSEKNEHDYCEVPSKFKLIRSKDRGGLIVPSSGVTNIVIVCEKAFRVTVLHKMDLFSHKRLKNVMLKLIYNELSTKSLFPTLTGHDFDHDILSGEMHSTQIIKKIADMFINIRCLTYGKYFTSDVLHGNKVGVRQFSTKLVLFQGI